MTKRTKTTRLTLVDALRVTLTILVIAHHAAQPYGPTGGAWPVSEPRRTALLAPFYAVNPMFFMGLFFLLAGYFAAHAYEGNHVVPFPDLLEVAPSALLVGQGIGNDAHLGREPHRIGAGAGIREFNQKRRPPLRGLRHLPDIHTITLVGQRRAGPRLANRVHAEIAIIGVRGLP